MEAEMELNDYQKAAQRTSTDGHNKLLNGVMGLSGEAGEVIDIMKKHMFQGHPFDEGMRIKLLDELGDVTWYLAEAAAGLDVTLDEIAQHNIDKLWQRYPAGFDSQRSRKRRENE
jgi:NTP pyrophosphatase (non-canonical NTP hydrolase)